MPCCCSVCLSLADMRPDRHHQMQLVCKQYQLHYVSCRQSGQPIDESNCERQPHAHLVFRRVGACLLLEVSEQEARLPQELLECGQLAASQPKL